ncbi:hypothetical protein SLEP1_g9411 [Rubroshorea leprosula]|uniref:LAGLIDADG homing endonuclease n=1 Tax=Rubroshorea leprosula TaxID=152421 RepID=A0AAV5IAS1_9ROSI|nr:hypothetical protein SLEP1_g9411 [Rubroshorea leprosula]
MASPEMPSGWRKPNKPLKVYHILDELLIAGELQESSKKTCWVSGFIGRDGKGASRFKLRFMPHMEIQDYG